MGGTALVDALLPKSGGKAFAYGIGTKDHSSLSKSNEKAFAYGIGKKDTTRMGSTVRSSMMVYSGVEEVRRDGEWRKRTMTGRGSNPS